MNVNPNRNLPATPATTAPAKQPAAPATVAAPPDFTASAELAEKLAATPEVRAAEVARAKALIADPNYPDAKTINAVARQLAENLLPPSDSTQS